MDVSFKGIENVGAFQKVLKEERKPLFQRFVFQVNNKGDKDLDKFRNILALYPDEAKFNFLKFDVLNKKLVAKAPSKYRLNGIPLILNDANLSIFSKISEVLKKVINSETKFTLANDYLDSADCDINLAKKFVRVINRGTGEIFDVVNSPSSKSDIHSFKNVQKSATSIQDEIEKDIIEHVKVKRK